MSYSIVMKCSNSLTILLLLSINFVLCVDLNYTEIYTVNDETRFTKLHPEAALVAFEKQRNAKGNIIFTAGERIPGDRPTVNMMDETQFTKAEDVEVVLQYPAKGANGSTITSVQIYADLSADDADSFFFEGGISKQYSQILIACNQTRHFTYEIFIYGY